MDHGGDTLDPPSCFGVFRIVYEAKLMGKMHLVLQFQSAAVSNLIKLPCVYPKSCIRKMKWWCKALQI